MGLSGVKSVLGKVYRGLGLAGLALSVSAIIFPRPLMPALARASTEPGRAFPSLAARFIDSEMRLFPERATEMGDHRFDTQLSDFSPGGIAAIINHAHEWKGRFSMFHSEGLSDADQADRQWLIARTDAELLWAEEVKFYRGAPRVYMPTGAVYSLISRDFAPLADRMRLVTAREQSALTNLEAARRNLRPEYTPAISVDVVLQEMPATIGFFKTDVPAAFASLPPNDAKRAFAIANDRLVRVLADYQRWLTGFRRNASPRYGLGTHAFKRMLADDDMVDVPLERLEQLGDAELARLQSEFKGTAETIDPQHSPQEVFTAISRKHPDADKLIARVRTSLGRLREFVIKHHLATISSDQEPRVRETPPWARATTFASMDSPGPLEKKVTEAYFYVTLPEPSWPAERKEQLLEFFSPASISLTAVHEVFPGHYLQFLINRHNPDLVRSLYCSGANIEGWAFYCEQMMLDENLHAGHPEYRMAQLQMALQRVARYLVAIRMHTAGMTVKEAAEFFENNAYMTPNNAMVEAIRGTQDPGYLRYQLGKFMILKLRDDVKAKEGAAFDLGKFHDAFLSQGGLPIKMIRRAMLGADSGPAL